MLARIIIGLLIVALGTIVVWKPRAFLGVLGPQMWGEKLFGPGHETTTYQAIGLILIILGFFIATNIIDSVLGAIFLPLIRPGE